MNEKLAVNRVAGVNADAIHSLCVEILDYKEKINNVLQTITDVVKESREYLYGDLREELYSKYNSLESSYNQILKNIDSYIDEYNALLVAEVELDLEVGAKLNAAISGVKSEGDEK